MGTSPERKHLKGPADDAPPAYSETDPHPQPSTESAPPPYNESAPPSYEDSERYETGESNQLAVSLWQAFLKEKRGKEKQAELQSPSH